MPPVSRRVPGHQGHGLHLLEWSTHGPALLFLHGFGMSARVWDPFAAALAPHYRVLALDARGHGDSDHDPDFRYGHAALTRDVEAVLEALGIERLALVGHSMGGFAAIRFAGRHPERVDRLALVDAGPELPSGHTERRPPRRSPPRTGFESEAAYASALGVLYPRAGVEQLAELARHWLRQRPDGRFELKLDPAFLRPRSDADAPERRDFDRARWAREESERLWQCLERIPCPTLVVRGARSELLGADTVEAMLRERLRRGTSVTIEGAGHAVMLDAPDAFGAALLRFFAADPGAGRD